MRRRNGTNRLIASTKIQLNPPCRLAQMGSKTLNFIGLLRATLHPNRGAITTCATSTGWWWHKAWHFEG